MAYLDNSSIIVDAILTKKGREKLAAGQSLNITQFALGDDEIDYQLYDAAHPKGSAYYDAAIKAIPILEASPDETQVLKYKLVTLPKYLKYQLEQLQLVQTKREVKLLFHQQLRQQVIQLQVIQQYWLIKQQVH
jgi:hypothetical protein